MPALAFRTSGTGYRLSGVLAAVVALLTVSVLVGVVGAGTASPAPTPPQPVPPVPGQPGPPPCQGLSCIPQPTTPAPPGNQPAQPGDQNSPQQSSCGITDIPACVNDAIDSFLRGLVTPALNSLLDLLANTLLTTPTLDQLPRIGELWNSSWQLMLACYGVLVLVGGIVVMTYETLQTRVSIKEILPRVIIGFLAGALSLWMCSQAITIANALAKTIMAGGVDENSATDTLKPLVLSSLNGGFFLIFIGLFLAVMLIALLVTYIVRVALTVMLIVGAPLALMCHALPHTEGIARWWWKAFGGCLAIQLGQSLTLITAMRVFLAPGGFTFFGPTAKGLVNLLVSLALMFILFKIPFWILGSIRGGGRSFLGSLVRGYLAYKTFGLLRGGGGGGTPKPRGGPTPPEPPDPYGKPRATPSGQYMLPLEGIKRQRSASRPGPQTASKARPAKQGRQLALPLDGEWPENKPRLGRDGQYQLPLQVQRQPKPTPPQVPPPQRQPSVHRDGVTLDRLLLAAVRQRLQPCRRISAPQPAEVPEWLAGVAHGHEPVAAGGLDLPAREVSEAGIVDLGPDGVAAVAACSSVNFALRTRAEQEALTAAFGRYLHSLGASVQILIRAQRLDLSGQIAELRERAAELPHPALESAALDHADYLAQLVQQADLLRRQILLVIREPVRSGTQDALTRPRRTSDLPSDGTRRAAVSRLLRRLSEAGELLSPAGITVTPLDAAHTSAVLSAATNPDSLPPSADVAGPGEVITGSHWDTEEGIA